jgi:hypothetical protein
MWHQISPMSAADRTLDYLRVDPKMISRRRPARIPVSDIIRRHRRGATTRLLGTACGQTVSSPDYRGRDSPPIAPLGAAANPLLGRGKTLTRGTPPDDPLKPCFLSRGSVYIKKQLSVGCWPIVVLHTRGLNRRSVALRCPEPVPTRPSAERCAAKRPGVSALP